MGSSSGFVLSDSAMYAFSVQDVYPDIVSFAAAIPPHLRSLFLIPIEVELEPVGMVDRVAARLASGLYPSGLTDVSEMVQNRTFVNYDTEASDPNSAPGSIFDYSTPGERTHHQEFTFDENWDPIYDTSYNKDVDGSGYTAYPYRLNERVTNSSIRPLIARLAFKPEDLEHRTPEKTKNRSDSCSISLSSYNKQTRVFAFSVNCGNGSHKVSAALSSIDAVSVTCDCKFWQYNGPEFHAKKNDFLLGQPQGKASPPEIRDPDRKHFLCKHTYAVISKIESFLSDVIDENWDLDDDDLLSYVDEHWSDLK